MISILETLRQVLSPKPSATPTTSVPPPGTSQELFCQHWNAVSSWALLEGVEARVSASTISGSSEAWSMSVWNAVFRVAVTVAGSAAAELAADALPPADAAGALDEVVSLDEPPHATSASDRAAAAEPSSTGRRPLMVVTLMMFLS